MNSSKKRVIISLWVLGLFTLTMLISPSLDGYGRVIDNHPYTINGLDNYIEDFSTTTYLDGATTASGWGSGTVTNIRNFTWTPLDFYETTSNYPVWEIAVQGRTVYAAIHNESTAVNSLMAFDIRDPAAIKLMSYRSSFSGIQSIAVDGDLVYSGYGPGTSDVYGINTYNVSNPFGLGAGGVFLGTESVDGDVTDIDIEGHLIYFTAFNSTSNRSLRILEAEDPYSRTIITPNWDSPKAKGIEVVRQLAYIAASDEGFYVLNISDKHSPVEVGHTPISGDAIDVIIDGHFAYVATGESGVTVVDVSNPTTPTVIGNFNTDGYARRLVKQGRTLFVADGTGGVVVLDVANPSKPAYVTASPIIPNVWDVALYGGILVVATSEGIYTFRICAGGDIADISNTWYANAFSEFQAWDVRVQGDIAYVAAGSDGFYTLNIRNPMNPILLDQWSDTGLVFKKLDVDGQFAHCIDDGGEYIFDVSDPTDIRHVHTTAGTNMIDIFVRGGLSFVTFLGSIGIGNSTLPDSYTIIASYSIGTNTTAIWVQGRKMYVVEYLGGYGQGLHILDISDLNNPAITESRSLTSYHWDVFVDGDYEYNANGRWLDVYNVTDPFSTDYTDYINYGNSINNVSMGVWGFGPYILNAKNHLGLSIVNATDFSNINDLYNYNDATSATQVITKGDYTYVANKSSLIILRHFMSAGDTYIPGTTTVQSLEIDTMAGSQILIATMTVDDYLPAGTSVEYSMSADGGLHWEAVTLGVEHTFLQTGEDLRWKAEITGPEYCSAHIYIVEINFEFSEGLSGMWIAIIAGASGLLLIIIATVVIMVVVKKKKATPTR